MPFSENKNNLTIGVIAGGISSEREVSLSTGKGIHKALLESGFRSVFIDFDGDLKKITETGMDVAFIALHGKYGEDGTIQGLMELMKIPYTGSGILASALAMDKIYSKKIFQLENIPTPAFMPLYSKNNIEIDKISKNVQVNIGYPVIVKPNRGGSTIGVTIVPDIQVLEEAVFLAFKYDSSILIEKFIEGRLLTVGIIGSDPVALPVIEIKPKSGFYDYAAKYTGGLTEYLVPAMLDSLISDLISETAIKCHNMLDCSALSRVDMIMDRKNDIHVLEVNTIPGMTPTSLVPKAAAAMGIDFAALTEIILNCASLKL
ncbi:MAG: D-alanine--D-alanine ligase [Actinobacteria bacterium]|nr:D-alanine--D-alanine ligase [Actinomycetota bacterium]